MMDILRIVVSAVHLISGHLNRQQQEQHPSSTSCNSLDLATPLLQNSALPSPRNQQLPPLRPTLYQIRVLLQLWKHGLVKGDASTVASRYSPGAVVIPFDSEIPLVGPNAILKYYQDLINMYRPTSINVVYGTVAIPSEKGNSAPNGCSDCGCLLAQDNGVYDICTHSGTILRMRYSFVYNKDHHTHGRWRIIHHNSSKICVIPASGVNDGRMPRLRQQEPQQQPFCQDDDDRDDTTTSTIGTTGVGHDPSEVPVRPAAQVDHLVELLTGAKSVTQNDLILLSTSDHQTQDHQDETGVTEPTMPVLFTSTPKKKLQPPASIALKKT